MVLNMNLNRSNFDLFELLKFVAFRLQRNMRSHRPEWHGTSSQTYSLTKISNFEFSVETEEYRGEETDDHENDGEETESDQTDKEETRGIVTGGILSNFLCISGRIGPFYTLFTKCGKWPPRVESETLPLWAFCFRLFVIFLSENSSEFLFHCSTPGHRSCQEKLHEVETAAVILVKYREYLVHHFTCVTFTRTWQLSRCY